MNTGMDRQANETKGNYIKRLVEASFSPAFRDRYEVYVVKDRADLTKIRIRARVGERKDGGTAVQLQLL